MTYILTEADKELARAADYFDSVEYAKIEEGRLFL